MPITVLQYINSIPVEVIPAVDLAFPGKAFLIERCEAV